MRLTAISQRIFKKFILIFSLFIFFEPSARADDAFVFKTGAISYSLGGFETTSGLNVSNASLGWEHVLDGRTAVLTGFEFSYSSLYSRFLNQNAFLGWRTYYGHPAWPLISKGDFGEISIESRHRWHSTVGIAIGRYLISVVGEYAALEASSEYLAPFIAGGYDYRMFEKTAVGIEIMPRIILGFGAISLRGYDLAVRLALTQKF